MDSKEVLFDNLAGGAGKQTLLKSTLRGMVDMIGITDRKANILLNINAIIITVVVTLGGIQTSSIDALNEQGLLAYLPSVLLMLTCLFSGVLAIRVAQPKKLQQHDKKHLGIFIMAREYRDIEAYLVRMAEVLKSNELIYQNMVTDIHTLSNHLISKNAYLGKAYLVLYIGISLSVISFITVSLITA